MVNDGFRARVAQSSISNQRLPINSIRAQDASTQQPNPTNLATRQHCQNSHTTSNNFLDSSETIEIEIDI